MGDPLKRRILIVNDPGVNDGNSWITTADVAAWLAAHPSFSSRYMTATRLGFQWRRNVNEAARGTLQSFAITFDTAVYNSGYPAVGASATVPAGGAGLYEFDGGVFFSVGAVGVQLAIRVNSLAIASSPAANGTTQSIFAHGMRPLAVGDVVDLWVYNGSAGNLTVLGGAGGDVINQQVPFLSCWRVGM